MRERAETEDIGFQGFSQCGSICAGLRFAELGRGVIQPLLVDVTNAGDLEFRICIESGGVVHAAFAHANNEDGIFAHKNAGVESAGSEESENGRGSAES